MQRRAAIAAALLWLTACAPASPTANPTGSAEESLEPPPSASTPESMGASPTAVGWRQLSIEGSAPAAREDHTWTLTPDGATAYLFGGRDGSTVFGDLWAYDLATDTWRVGDDTGRPPARFGHNAAWVEGIGLVIFAGQAGAAFFGDLWAYDPATNAWSELPTGGASPVARYGSCAAVGPDGRLWISHGFTADGRRFADTWAYDFAVSAWTDETPPADQPVSRCLHGCWWTDDGAFVLYAGQTTGVTALGDRWQLTPGERPGTNAWIQLDPEPRPADRNLYAQARWAAAMLVIGGQGLDGGYLADAWLLADGGDTTLVEVDGAPPGRAGAEMIADPAHSRILLFGGTDADGARDDLWELTIPVS